MGLRICVLGSGSKGNATFVASERTAILIDAGLSGKETRRRLAEVGSSLDAIQAVCVSHEHSDHTAGLKVLHGRHGIPVYANAGTVEGLQRDRRLSEVSWKIFTNGSPFVVGDLTVESFSVPHDAYDPVGFVVTTGGERAGVVTDMGVPTTLIRERLRACRVVVVEANHDEGMLKAAERPLHLKQRILGRQGHLSNESAAAMLAEIASPELRHVFLAHISDDCNEAYLAVGTARRRLDEQGHTHVRVSATYADRISEVWAG